MFDLKCKRQGCRYNQNCNCKAGAINVDKGTKCVTYEDTGIKENQRDEIKQTATRNNTDVYCDAECLFNNNHICTANGISVMTNDFSPECCTFMPK